jgi:chorismate mutase
MVIARDTEDPAQACQRLEAERLRIQREITSYPAPIPACDAHFNHLLEQRAMICDELARIRASEPDSRSPWK